jgi:hypothetical protein
MEKLKAKHLVKKWVEISGELSDDHRYFSNTIAKKLATGNSFSVGELDQELHIPIRRIKKLLGKRPITSFNDDKNIVSHTGLSVVDTGIHMSNNAKLNFYASSAFESLAMSTFLNSDLTLKTKCLHSNKEIIINLTPNGYETNFDDVMVSFVSLNDLNLEKLLKISDWSIFIASSELAEEWIEKQNPDLLLMPLSLAYQSARNTYEELYKLDT